MLTYIAKEEVQEGIGLAILTLTVVYNIAVLLPYIKYATKEHFEYVNIHNISQLEFIKRIKLNTWISTMMVMALIFSIGVLLMLSIFPLRPYQYLTTWQKLKTILALFLMSFSRSLLHLCLLSVSTYLLTME